MTVAISVKSDMSKYTDAELMDAWREWNTKAAVARELADAIMRELNRRPTRCRNRP